MGWGFGLAALEPLSLTHRQCAHCLQCSHSEMNGNTVRTLHL